MNIAGHKGKEITSFMRCSCAVVDIANPSPNSASQKLISAFADFLFPVSHQWPFTRRGEMHIYMLNTQHCCYGFAHWKVFLQLIEVAHCWGVLLLCTFPFLFVLWLLMIETHTLGYGLIPSCVAHTLDCAHTFGCIAHTLDYVGHRLDCIHIIIGGLTLS